MRWAAFVACIIAASEAMDKAVGIEAQVLFAPSAVWLWWVPALGWPFIGGFILWRGTDR
jgi:hypothetical protein